ncbi:MAG: hypothetical protein ACE5HY_05405 [Candidatus Hydrothermarchaeales archaeon]
MPEGWKEHGGKWLVYGDLEDMKKLAIGVEPLIEKREIDSAKFWTSSDERSAMCVYSWDRDKEETRKLLIELGFKPLAYEYDYARRKNWTRLEFYISHLFKLRILLKSFSLRELIRFLFQEEKEADKQAEMDFRD